MNTLYSAGYVGTTLAALQAKAEALNAVIADVRFMPYSRNPDFRQVHMRRVLEARYTHVLALGNRNYKSAALPFDLVSAETGSKVIQRLLTDNSVILLCACRHVDTCHRKLICEIMYADHNILAVHLTNDDINDALPKVEQIEIDYAKE